MRKDLDARLELETPEQVVLSLPLGGVGSRMAAYALDLLVRLGLSLLLVVPTVFVVWNWPGMGIQAVAGALVALFLLHFGYYVYHDVAHRGQTPGRRRMGLRVIKVNGAPVDFLSSVIRNLLRALDWAPGFYGLGVAAMFVSAREQRLGDIAAGTVVICEKGAGGAATTAAATAAQYEETCREMGIVHPDRIRPNLSPDEADALARLLAGAPFLAEEKAGEIVRRLAERLRLKVADPEGELAPYLAERAGWVQALRFLLARHLAEQQRAGTAAAGRAA